LAANGTLFLFANFLDSNLLLAVFTKQMLAANHAGESFSVSFFALVTVNALFCSADE